MSCWPVSFALVSKAEGGVTEFMKRDLGGRKFDDTATGPPDPPYFFVLTNTKT